MSFKLRSAAKPPREFATVFDAEIKAKDGETVWVRQSVTKLDQQGDDCLNRLMDRNVTVEFQNASTH